MEQAQPTLRETLGALDQREGWTLRDRAFEKKLHELARVVRANPVSEAHLAEPERLRELIRILAYARASCSLGFLYMTRQGSALPSRLAEAAAAGDGEALSAPDSIFLLRLALLSRSALYPRLFCPQMRARVYQTLRRAQAHD